VVGGIAVGEGNEEDVFLAGAFDLARTDHAFGVGQQDDLEQDLGMDGCCAGHIVFVAFIEDRQIDVLIHQSVDGVLQCPRNQLVLERNGEHDHLIFIAWNGLRYLRVGGRGQSVWEQEKLEARKMLENAAESHTSGARFVHCLKTRRLPPPWSRCSSEGRVHAVLACGFAFFSLSS
jgi:hypothetical protein